MFRLRSTLTAMYLATWVAPLVAAEPDVSSKAEQLVDQALQAEVDGDLVLRQRLLAEATIEDTAFAPAHWHSGKIQESPGEWVSAKELMERGTLSRTVREYESRRVQVADSTLSQWEFANWCYDAKLYDQARAHLNRVVALDGDHVPARLALGYQVIGGEWVSPNELAAMEMQAQATAGSLKKFRIPLERIAQALAAPKLRGRETAIEELRAIDSAEAIPAADQLLGTSSEAGALELVDWIGGFDSVIASQTLLKYALLHPAVSVQVKATEALKKCPLHDYVPDLLKMLSTPISTMLVPRFNADGTIAGYQQAFSRELHDRIESEVLNTTVQRQRQVVSVRLRLRDAGDWVASVDRGLQADLATEAQNQALLGTRDNAAIQYRNRRIAELLSDVSNREFSGNPREMWKWWDDYNQTNYQDYKPERYRRTQLVRTTVQYVPEVIHECFVAGTSVATQFGARPIERLSIGDRVLCRDLQSGELCFKPVLRTTIRAAEPTVAVKLTDEVLQCSPGHLLWISGAGWKRANELEEGDLLHGVEEPSVVLSVTESASAQTYNLEVADTNCYFVGKNLVLSHDVTPRGANHLRVPGLQIAGN